MTKKTLLPILLMLLMLCASCTRCTQQPKPEAYQSIDTVPMLIMQIQKCSRLYTTEYQVHKIVTHNDVVRLKGSLLNHDYDLPLPLGDRKVAIPMDATLKAYIDFEQLTEANIERHEGKITVTLPDPKVMLTSSKIDQKNIREYVSLMRAHFSDRELSAYEQRGREAILQSIPQLGIVETARESAARLLIPIISQMGFQEQDITIVFRTDFDPTDLKKLIDQNTQEP